MNSHFSFSNVNLREKQAHRVAKKVRELSSDMPVIFMGDLNTFPQRLDQPRFPFYDGDYIHQILTASGLRDAKEVSLLGHLGPIGNFTNAEGEVKPFQGTGTPGVFLDHIYVTEGIQVLIHVISSDRVDGLFPSDHMPIVVDVIAS